MYVHVPSDNLGNTSLNAYGTLDIADIPEPDCSISNTPMLFIMIAKISATSPLSISLLLLIFFDF